MDISASVGTGKAPSLGYLWANQWRRAVGTPLGGAAGRGSEPSPSAQVDAPWTPDPSEQFEVLCKHETLLRARQRVSL